MNDLLTTAIAQRHALHRLAELSNEEHRTSEMIFGFMQGCHPLRVHRNVGGTGVIAEFGNKNEHPVTLLRAELDALPIPEKSKLPHASDHDGVSHKCGHDGHMAILCGVALHLRDHRPKKGRVALLFQPAEETGEGARRMLEDERLQELKPDAVYALHNLPGYAKNSVVVRKGLFAAASSGLIVRLKGRTSHAAEPHKGNSPARALAHLLNSMSSVPHYTTGLFDSAQVTVIHARLGERAFGTSPGDAELMLTLRSESGDWLSELEERCKELAKRTATVYGLRVSFETVEPFPASRNSETAVDQVVASAKRAELTVHTAERPFAWSEDFGHMLAKFGGALFGLGAGESHAALHHPDYDFPDAVIESGVRLFIELITETHSI
ncbi:MAG: amidohydrolase [Calditrichaeota bacterium]|nr:amidohydrolase [Calditrichota bacterium]MCB9365598.1 amidohydrolase [Calditrichota bacterium]